MCRASGTPALREGIARRTIDRTLHRVDDACELRQQAIAHQLDYATVMSLQRRLDQVLEEHAQRSERAGFIYAD